LILLAAVAILSACAAPAETPPVSTSGPLQVSLPTTRFIIGKPATFTVSYRGLPEGAGMELSLEPVDPQSEQEIGPTGPLMARHVPISGSGQVKWTWPGKAVFQAPADAPIPVDIKPGRYRITAKAVDRVTCTICFRIPIKTLAEWQSGPIEVVAP
jgi:hypothetical protein